MPALETVNTVPELARFLYHQYTWYLKDRQYFAGVVPWEQLNPLVQDAWTHAAQQTWLGLK